MRITRQLIHAVLIGALAVAPVFTQKFRTDIPPAITIPDSVETRLGTLKFKDAFPDDATVQKVYDNVIALLYCGVGQAVYNVASTA